MTQIIDWLNQHNISVATVAGTVAILIVAALVIFAVNRLLQRWLTYLQDRLHLTFEANLIVRRIVVIASWAVTGFIILNVWGVGLSGVWAVLISAVTVVGVGFLATWAMISNLTASFFLVLWRPFHVGQIVEVLPENLKGRVTDRNLMFTTLREESGAVLQIPNNFFFQKVFRVSGETAVSAGLREHGEIAPLVPEISEQKISPGEP